MTAVVIIAENTLIEHTKLISIILYYNSYTYIIQSCAGVISINLYSEASSLCKSHILWVSAISYLQFCHNLRVANSH